MQRKDKHLGGNVMDCAAVSTTRPSSAVRVVELMMTRMLRPNPDPYSVAVYPGLKRIKGSEAWLDPTFSCTNSLLRAWRTNDFDNAYMEASKQNCWASLKPAIDDHVNLVHGGDLGQILLAQCDSKSM